MLALVTEWAHALGPLGIGLIALGTAFIGLVSIASFQATVAKRRLRQEQISAMKKWNQVVDNINPLEREFHTKRIDLKTFFNPLTKMAENKRLISCELMGPANITFLSNSPNSMLSNSVFTGCDIVVVREGSILQNISAIQNSTILDCRIYNCTIFIPPALVPVFAAMGARFSTLTGDPNIDNQPPQGVSSEAKP